MRFSERARRERMVEPVEATLQVVIVVTRPEPADRWAACRLTGVLRRPGRELAAVALEVDAPADRWPHPGQLLPVVADLGDPDDAALTVRWEEVPTHLELAEQVAVQLAEGSEGGGPPGYGTADGV